MLVLLLFVASLVGLAMSCASAIRSHRKIRRRLDVTLALREELRQLGRDPDDAVISLIGEMQSTETGRGGFVTRHRVRSMIRTWQLVERAERRASRPSRRRR